jgi:hypothetical protein
MDSLARRGLIPNFHRAALEMPFGGFNPQGAAIGQLRIDALPAFWSAYAARANATLRWRGS